VIYPAFPAWSRKKTEKELDDEMLGEEWKNKNDEENESDEEDEDNVNSEEEELDPVLEHYSFPHSSGGLPPLLWPPNNSARRWDYAKSASNNSIRPKRRTQRSQRQQQIWETRSNLIISTSTSNGCTPLTS